MSSESIVTALFLISAVIAAGVLITAIFPAIYRTADTFGSASHEADVQMRTDIKIVNYFYSGSSGNVWLKNIGSYRIGTSELDESDIFYGPSGEPFTHTTLGDVAYAVTGDFWDQGETLTIPIDSISVAPGDPIYFAIVLPNGVRRSVEFAAD